MNIATDNATPLPHTSEADFLEATRAQAEHGLFLVRFNNWRLSISGAILLGLIVGGLFYYLTRTNALLWWMTLNTVPYVVIACMCWYYEKHLPDAASQSQRYWLKAWTGVTAIGSLVTGSIIWYLPPDRKDLLLSATVIVSIVMIGFVASRGYRPLLYATVTAQTTTQCLALLFHANMPMIVPICLVFAGFVLSFGLMLNRSMLTAIGQRLYAQHLSAELEEAHRQQLRVQQLETALKERKRMMDDMHDGLGSTLISSLLMLENNTLSTQGAASIVRECVDDLRLIVDSQESAAQDLSTLVGMLRYRLQPRIQAAGIRLRWMIDDLPERPWLNPSQSLDLLRILQEAITNVLKHAGASEIEFIAHIAEDKVEFAIVDNGCGFAPTDVPVRGRGLRSMHTRAERLGARLRIETIAPKGSAVTLILALPIRPWPNDSTS